MLDLRWRCLCDHETKSFSRFVMRSRSIYYLAHIVVLVPVSYALLGTRRSTHRQVTGLYPYSDGRRCFGSREHSGAHRTQSSKLFLVSARSRVNGAAFDGRSHYVRARLDYAARYIA